MYKYLVSITTVLCFFLLPVLATAQLTADELAQRTYDRYLGDDMQMRGTMELISKRGHIRSRDFTTLRKDSGVKRKVMIRFTSPADISGTAFLNIESENSKTEQHLYLPALKRTRRIVASQKSRSFVNSDFTYEDMQRHAVADWAYRLEGTETISGYDCYRLISTPKVETDTQYSKVVSWVEKEHFLPLKTLFYDDKGLHIKTYSVDAFEVINNVATEMNVLMEDLISGHKTRLKTLEIKYNSGLKDALFTTRALEK